MLRTKWEKSGQTFLQMIAACLARPFLLLGTQPIVQVLAIYIAFLSGLIYIILTTFATVWTTLYGQSVRIAGLHYLALAVGYVVGTQSSARLLDVVYEHLKKTRGRGIGHP